MGADFVVYVPKELCINDISVELKMGILMAYCWTKRFGTLDGYFEGSLRNIIKKYGLHYDETKTKRYPAQIKTFIRGLEYLKNNKYISLVSGDYNDLDSQFKIRHLKRDTSNNGFITLKFKDFDFILDLKKRTNKMGLLYTLLFVLSCFNVRENNNIKESFCVCSYSLDNLSKKLDIKRLSLYKYLKQMSTDEGKVGDTPLIKSRPWCAKIKGKVIHFPNIYVENNENAARIIQYQKHEIYIHFQSNDNADKEESEMYDPVDDDVIY